MSVVYFTDNAFEKLLSNGDIPDKKHYDLILRKKCCNKIYFPKCKSSLFDILEKKRSSLEALDIDNLNDQLSEDQLLDLALNTDFFDLFDDHLFNIHFFEDILNYDTDDIVKLFIVDDQENELKNRLFSNGFHVETITSLGKKDLTKIVTEATSTKGDWTWIRKRIVPSCKRLIWIDKYLISNILFQALTLKMKGYFRLANEFTKDNRLVSDDEINKFLLEINKINYYDLKKDTPIIEAIKKISCKFLYTNAQKNKLITAFLLQEAKCLLSNFLYPTFFKNFTSKEVLNVDVLYFETSNDNNLKNLLIEEEDIIKNAFESIFEVNKIISNINVTRMSADQKRAFGDRYIITNNVMIKAKLKPNLFLHPDIYITHNHFTNDSEYLNLCDKARINL
tara:strand:- start:19 stop:1200 length:1182 start_codon:yes stop_codon:yes gene_type:complete